MLMLISVIFTVPSHEWIITYRKNNQVGSTTAQEIIQATTHEEAKKKFLDKYKDLIEHQKITIKSIMREEKTVCWSVEFKLNNQKKTEVVEQELRSECAIFLREKYKGNSLEIIKYNKILSDGNLKAYMPEKYLSFPVKTNAVNINGATIKVEKYIPKYQSGCDFVIEYELLDEQIPQKKTITFWAEDDSDARAMLKKKINIAQKSIVIKSCTRIK